MAKNKLSDLNDHLFAQLERLNDEEMIESNMELEVQKAKAISSVATQIINGAKVTLEAMKLINKGSITKEELPDNFGFKRIELGG